MSDKPSRVRLLADTGGVLAAQACQRLKIKIKR